jgi:acetylglutamate kinase
MSRIVVKVGGAVASQSAEAVLELGADNEVCVVHGAGPQISLEMERAGIPVEFVGGRRVTTFEGIQVVIASLEAVNTELCKAIGERAVPFFAHEIGFWAVPIEELGLVGDPRPQDIPAIERVLDAGKIPVVAPLSKNDRWQPPTIERLPRAAPIADRDHAGSSPYLNVNADDAAAMIAVSLDADKLLFMTNVEGFLLDGEVVESLDVPTAEQLFRSGTLDPTILPKLGAGIEAARHGVPAFIGRTEVLAIEDDEMAWVVNRALGSEGA